MRQWPMPAIFRKGLPRFAIVSADTEISIVPLIYHDVFTGLRRVGARKS